MLVFTEIWLQELAQRYRNYKRHTKPFVYFVATEEEFQPVRKQIEDWVLLLPEHLRKRAITSLQSENGIQQTYHELAVGSILRNLELKPEYEQNFNGLTPDWYVSAGDGSKFIVEVLTENSSKTVEAWDARLSELHGRISELLCDFALSIDIPFDWNSICLDSRRSKFIANEVKNWLIKANPPIGAELQLDEFTFEVAFRDRKFVHVMLIGPCRPFWVNAQPLCENIEGKIHKYKTLAESYKIPFVVALVAEFRTGYGVEELESVLFGQKSNGLFVKKPLLSGAIWAWKSKEYKWQMKSYLNPLAQNRLPTNVFGSNSLES
jgi:hypothetical protein